MKHLLISPFSSQIFPGRAASPCTLPALSGGRNRCYQLGLGEDDERCVEKVRSTLWQLNISMENHNF